jgi:LysR family transcriptional regulator, benzoate and cis,cis-muconate-responsive activator of ben and cat genes
VSQEVVAADCLEARLELRRLRYFIVAAEAGHFGRAADRLRISGPALGQQIKEFEDEVGVELFERLPRGVRLSAAGVSLLADARRILGDLEASAERARDIGRGAVGTLRLAHIPVRASRWLDMIPSFCAHYPNVDVRSVDLNAAEQVAALVEGRIDLGIGHPPTTSGALASEIFDQILLDCALLPAAHPLCKKNPLRCRDLAVLPLLQPPAATNPSARDLIVRELRQRGLEALTDEEHQFTDATVRIGFVAAGAGWMPANSEVVGTWLGGRRDVVVRKWVDKAISYPLCLVWRADERSPVVTNFLTFLRTLRETTAVPNNEGVA